MIEAVLFDGDQTLWDFERVMRQALVAVADEMRAARPGAFTAALRWEDLQGDRTAVAEEHEDVWSLSTLRALGFGRTLQRCRDAEGGNEAADDALARQLADSYFAHRDRDPALFPDTVPCLDALRADYRLGLLSNGSRLPETVGLAGYFETVVFAQDHRVAKPDKGIFEVVERALGVAPDACVLVGDHPHNDVSGAKRAGWRAVWLDRDDTGACDVEEVPDAVVRSLGELPEVVERLR
jgi:HAD superfamily hydrolase (TIGR01509 family)